MALDDHGEMQMANQRVVDADVKQILDTSLDTQPFIVAANLTVTERLAGEYTDARLQQIELYLSAHLAALRDPRLTELTVDGTTARYEHGSQAGVGLLSTRYGQTVQQLDYKGILAQDAQTTVAASLRVF